MKKTGLLLRIPVQYFRWLLLISWRYSTRYLMIRRKKNSWNLIPCLQYSQVKRKRTGHFSNCLISLHSIKTYATAIITAYCSSLILFYIFLKNHCRH
ncbi:MAG: hypothetical protein D3923_12470, partial [Candidatus Electrothrix sp. AR3]|nr:hypothetical protein [Candidatus Electrothrix sp. AR3]